MLKKTRPQGWLGGIAKHDTAKQFFFCLARIHTGIKHILIAAILIALHYKVYI